MQVSVISRYTRYLAVNYRYRRIQRAQKKQVKNLPPASTVPSSSKIPVSSGPAPVIDPSLTGLTYTPVSPKSGPVSSGSAPVIDPSLVGITYTPASPKSGPVSSGSAPVIDPSLIGITYTHASPKSGLISSNPTPLDPLFIVPSCAPADTAVDTQGVFLF